MYLFGGKTTIYDSCPSKMYFFSFSRQKQHHKNIFKRKFCHFHYHFLKDLQKNTAMKAACED